MKKIFFLMAAGLSFATISCRNLNNSQPSASQQDIQILESSLEAHKNEIIKLQGFYAQLSQNDNQLALKIQELDARLNAVALQSGNTDQFQKEINAIRSEMKAIDDARVRDGRNLAEAVSGQINTVTRQVNDLNGAVRQVASAPRSTPAATSSSNQPPPGKYYKHTVKNGETLGAIAQAYGVTVRDIQTANKISGTNIGVGQELLVPQKK